MFGAIGPELRNQSLEAERYLYKGPKQPVLMPRQRSSLPSSPKKINSTPAQSAC
ncbi:hypothetical protein M422DRAFT_32132 [Sphaerobolus stellatus SS14]|uniref:Unplaced genomic scaffold SPHSTscaffold_67, whole genome shotgun sequence n=1 Tax=Sphaerobolus stellatus (strain SS14) TaxID=990650 RepID=A0A0C9V0N3_SPHS4|nr:hypothetical protein M422DRAFT_32132 [Sphaerobolus stellatus SS14]